MLASECCILCIVNYFRILSVRYLTNWPANNIASIILYWIHIAVSHSTSPNCIFLSLLNGLTIATKLSTFWSTFTKRFKSYVKLIILKYLLAYKDIGYHKYNFRTLYNILKGSQSPIAYQKYFIWYHICWRRDIKLINGMEFCKLKVSRNIN